jgi:hypothetical protein
MMGIEILRIINIKITFFAQDISLVYIHPIPSCPIPFASDFSPNTEENTIPICVREKGQLYRCSETSRAK